MSVVKSALARLEPAAVVGRVLLKEAVARVEGMNPVPAVLPLQTYSPALPIRADEYRTVTVQRHAIGFDGKAVRQMIHTRLERDILTDGHPVLRCDRLRHLLRSSIAIIPACHPGRGRTR